MLDCVAAATLHEGISAHFAGALKHDELRTLTVENVVFAQGGIRVTVAAGNRAPRDVVILAGIDR